MEALFSAAVGEVFSRCLSFLINKYPTMLGVSEEESLQKLEKALLRVAITVEEAEGRFITNKGMLQQLKMLQKEIYKGYYVLDKFKYLDGEDAEQIHCCGHLANSSFCIASVQVQANFCR